MKLIKRKNVHWVDFVSPDGKRRRLSTGHTDEVKAYARAAEIVSAHMGAGKDAKKLAELNVPTLGELLDAKLASHWSKMSYGTTMKYTVGKLKREIGHMRVPEVTTKYLRDWKTKWLTGGLKKSTVNRYMNAIGATLKDALADKLITELPKLEFSNEGEFVRERYMLDHEEPRIIEWMKRMESDAAVEERWEWEYIGALFVFLADTGFRFSEAFKFTLIGQEADLEHGCTKNTIGRRIPLTSRAFKAAQYLLACAHHRELDRRSAVRAKAAWDWVTHRTNRCFEALGINTADTPARRKLTLHCLRHTCASRLLDKGVNIVVVSRWLGHANIKTTMRYLKLDTKPFLAGAAALEDRSNAAAAAARTAEDRTRDRLHAIIEGAAGDDWEDDEE